MDFLKRFFEPKVLAPVIAVAEKRLERGQRSLLLMAVDRDRQAGLALPDDPTLQLHMAAASLALRNGTETEPIRLREVSDELRKVILCYHAGLFPEDETAGHVSDLFPDRLKTIENAASEVGHIAGKFWAELFGASEPAGTKPGANDETQWYEATKLFELTPERDLKGFLGDKGADYLHLLATVGIFELERDEIIWIADRPELDAMTAAYLHLVLETLGAALTAEEAAVAERLTRRLQAGAYQSAGYRLGPVEAEIAERRVQQYRAQDRNGRWSLSDAQLDALCVGEAPSYAPMICGWMSGWSSVHSCGLKAWQASRQHPSVR